MSTDALHAYILGDSSGYAAFLRAHELPDGTVDVRTLLAAGGRTIRSTAADDPLHLFAAGLVEAYYTETRQAHLALADVTGPARSGDSRVLTRPEAEPPVPPGNGFVPDSHLAFVQKYGGDENRVIRRVLVANNGMAAVKVILGIRAWARKNLGDPKAIEVVVMATPEDIKNELRFIDMADIVEPVPQGEDNLANYANVDLIVRIALKYGADAVHPGWGHASEETYLAKRLEEEGVIFMGPGSRAMHLLGDKISSLLLYQTANGEDTVAPWSGMGLKIPEGGEITDDLIAQARVMTKGEAVETAKRIGFPVMLKAAGVGGGRGMRKCYSPEDLEAKWDEVVAESMGSDIFVMALALETRMVRDVAEGLQAAEQLGFPVVLRKEGSSVKIDSVTQLTAELTNLFAERSLEAALGDGVESSGPHKVPSLTGSPGVVLLGGGQKHIEVQVMADLHGNAIAFWPRDCSVQRRSQKVIEETASIPPEIAQKLMRAAVELSKRAGYSGLGTVEFLIDPTTHKVADVRIVFLEENTRVQVEHPVTEGTTDIDFIETQMFLSQGLPLHKIPQIRRYFGENPEGESVLDYEKMYDIPPDGHVIALRIVSEDPENQWKMSTGEIRKLDFQGLRGVWGYFAVGQGGGVGVSSDSQIGHVFIHGRTRAEATAKALVALDQLTVFGEVKTNIPYLHEILQHPDFVSGKIHNNTLDRWIEGGTIQLRKADRELAAVASVLVRAARMARDQEGEFLASIQKGHIPDSALLSPPVDFLSIVDSVKYEFSVQQAGPHTFIVTNNHNRQGVVEAKVFHKPDGSLTIEFGGKRHHVLVDQGDDAQRLVIDDAEALVELKEEDPTKLKSRESGKILEVHVRPGQTIVPGDLIADAEVSKQNKKIYADKGGTIARVLMAEKVPFRAGNTLIEFEPDPSVPKKIYPVFGRAFSTLPPPSWKNSALSPEQERLLLDHLFLGFTPPPGLDLAGRLVSHLDYLGTQKRWAVEFQDFLSQYRKGMPEGLYTDLMAYAKRLIREGAKKEVDPGTYVIEVQKMIDRDEYRRDFKVKEELYAKYRFHEKWDAFVNDPSLFAPQKTYLVSLLDRTIADETCFANPKIGEPLAWLRDHRNDPKLGTANVARIIRAHQSHAVKVRLVIALLDQLPRLGIGVREVEKQLKDLAAFGTAPFNAVSAKAKALLLGSDETETPAKRRAALAAELRKIAGIPEDKRRAEEMRRLISRPRSIFADLAPLTLLTDEPKVALYATIVYQRRSFVNYPNQIYSTKSRSERPSVYFAYRYPHETTEARFGLVTAIPRLNDLWKALTDMAAEFGEKAERAKQNHYHHLTKGNYTLAILTSSDQSLDPARLLEQMAAFRGAFESAGIKRITLGVVTGDGVYPSYFTYRVEGGQLFEDVVYRNIEPPLAHQLDFELMKNFALTPVPTVGNEIYIYSAVDKKAKPADRDPDRRFFVRSVVRGHSVDTATNRYREVDDRFFQSINNLDIALDSQDPKKPHNWNEIFLNILPPFSGIADEEIVRYLANLVDENKDRLNLLSVYRVEFKFRVTDGDGRETTWRVDVRNHPKTRLQYTIYTEWRTPEGRFMVKRQGEEGVEKVLEPYKILDPIDKRRLRALALGTTYAYDWPDLFRDGVERQWEEYLGLVNRPKEDLFSKRELYLGPGDRLVEDVQGSRPIGANINRDDPSQTNGAVAFRLTMKTPEYPDGREMIIVIANDVNVSNGSFSPREAALYTAAARRAIDEGIPFIAIQANTGARFGLEAEVIKQFKVAYSFKDPAKGFSEDSNVVIDYLYLTAADHEALKDKKVVVCEEVRAGGVTRFKIVAVPGATIGLDADSLRGSGYIAGISDEAYEKIFTASLVSGYMAVGIGSYLARLLHRVVQNGPMVLTGYKALNAALGAQRYLNNLQLGGKEIMVPNGVAYWAADNDMTSVDLLLRTLGFIPKTVNDLPPVGPTADIPHRPLKTPGKADLTDPHFIPKEFFDTKSYRPETDLFMDAYGKTVHTGRGKLMGRAIGFITLEPNNVVRTIPADPGDPASTVRTEDQAHNVLHPDSSLKLAEAVENFNHEGLGTIIFADTRGFSAGGRDMFYEVVKYGSMIVTAIRKATKPVYIYFPPFSQMRGGAWVVFDKAINGEGRVRMFAAEDARGGVVEPPMQIEILGRSEVPRQLERLRKDLPELRTLHERLARNRAGGEEGDAKAVEKEIAALEALLAPFITRILEAAADLQHRAQAMKARGVIDDVIRWEEARRNFHIIYERDLELLDFEREVKREYPTIRPRDLKKLLTEFSGHLEGRGIDANPVSERRYRAEKMEEVRHLKAERYGREALTADPAAALTAQMSEYARRARFLGRDPDPEIMGLFSAQMALAESGRFLTNVPSRIELYLKIVATVKEVGLWREADSDEDNPIFYDASGRLFEVTIDREKELTVKLVDGPEEGLAAHWSGMMASQKVRTILRDFQTIRLLRADGTVIDSLTPNPLAPVPAAPAAAPAGGDPSVRRPGGDGGGGTPPDSGEPRASGRAGAIGRARMVVSDVAPVVVGDLALESRTVPDVASPSVRIVHDEPVSFPRETSPLATVLTKAYVLANERGWAHTASVLSALMKKVEVPPSLFSAAHLAKVLRLRGLGDLADQILSGKIRLAHHEVALLRVALAGGKNGHAVEWESALGRFVSDRRVIPGAPPAAGVIGNINQVAPPPTVPVLR